MLSVNVRVVMTCMCLWLCQLQQPPVVESSTALASSRASSKQFVQCTKCGRTNAPEARFCDWCGTKVRLLNT